MKRRDFIIKASSISLVTLIIPQILGCKSKIELETLIGQNTNSLEGFEKTGDENLSFHHLKASDFSLQNFEAKEAFLVSVNNTILGFRAAAETTDFKRTQKELETKLGKATDSYKNEYGWAKIWLKDGLKYEVSQTLKSDIIKAQTFLAISESDTKLLYF